MALYKNVLIPIIHNVSVYSVKQCINSNVKLLTVNVILLFWAEFYLHHTKQNRMKQYKDDSFVFKMYTNNFG